MDTPAGAAPDTIMTDSTTPTTTPSSIPNSSINGESIQVNGTTTTTSNLTVAATAHLVTEADKAVLANTNTIAQDLTLSDIAHAPILSAADLLSQDPSSLIEPSHGVTITPSIPSVDLTPLTTTVPGFGVSILPGLDLSVNAANDEFIVMDNGLITGTTETVDSGLLNAPVTAVAKPDVSVAQVGDTQSSSSLPGGEKTHSTATLVSWQDILVNMLSELGFVESSRMMAAEELVLSKTQQENAPKIIEKFTRLLQESTPGSVSTAGDGLSGSSKRQNSNSGDFISGTLDGHDAIKRRRVDDARGMVLENATRDEIEERMIQFMANKREQINESNRQEFIKGRVPNVDLSGTNTDTQDADAEDDGCARVDARKLNRTIQMKLETVKNEALTKTNPKSHAQQSDLSMTSNGQDERLRNIQVHLNLRFVAVPVCTIAERIRIVEDVIIQLERDYPLWSALHFNQPNRAFPPPPSVTTVSRNGRNQIVMSGEHLHTTLIDSGDPVANPAALTQFPGVGMLHAPSGSPTTQVQRHGGQDTGLRTGVATNTSVNNIQGAGPAVQARPGVASPGSASSSATVIKLKRHGGAGSSSLARAVQQQLAQRKANAAASGTTDDPRHSYGTTPSFKITPTPHRDSPSDSGSTLSMTGGHPSNSSPGRSLSPNISFTDPLKPGVTGRGPIKSRRKSIAKGLDPVSAMASMNVAHAGNILGTNPGAGRTVGAPMSLGSQPSVMLEASLGSLAASKAKAASAKKPRKKKGDEGADLSGVSKLASRPGAGRGKGGFGLGKGKGGGRPAMGLGLGKGKGGAYRQELLRQAEVEEFDDYSDEDVDDDGDFQSNSASTILGTMAKAPAGTGNGSLTAGNTTTFENDNSALAHLVSSALKEANAEALAQQKKQREQQQQKQQQQQQAPAPTIAKAKKAPKKPSTPAKPPPVRKFGGKSFGMVGGESSGSSNESSDGEGSGSSGSQSDSSSSSGSISGSDPGDSD
ncbi:hypothetical protein EC957_009629 [Mortierella hygrophila]|uniref:Uncharacterized protein n=1 Tax=Mortierella hygrophila TaxID=979708 RepID=A0A9P6K597_9FUNG|nr:hypothetical protein EC957_009629 [Mortierella hygrophila]